MTHSGVDRKRIVILEPGLRDTMGHYFNVSYMLAQECRSRKLPCVVFSNINVRPDVVSAFPVRIIPHFYMGTYFGSSSDPLSADVENYMQVDFSFGQDMRRLLPALSSDDIVIIPTASERIIRCLAQQMTQVPSARRPRIVLSFSFDPHGVDDPERVLAMRMLYRAGFNALNASPARDWFTLVTNSAFDEYERLAGRPLTEVPVAQPSPYFIDRFRQNHRPGARLRIPFLGVAAARKGFHLLPDIIQRVMKSGVKAQFQVQVCGYGPGGGPAEDMLPYARQLDELAVRHPATVKLFRTPLSIHDYYRVLGRADMVLAAYSPEYDQISGVYHEAVGFGKTVVTRDGSVLAKTGRQDNIAMVTFGHFAAADIADGVIRAAHSLDALAGQAQAAADAWRQRHGTAIYLDRILEVCARDHAVLHERSRDQETMVSGDGVTGLWFYRMINPDHFLAVRRAVWDGEQPEETQRVLDRILMSMERDTGAVSADLADIAQWTALSQSKVRQALQRLKALGAVDYHARAGSRRRAWFINPHLAWFGNLSVRDDLGMRVAPPLSDQPSK